MKRAPANWYIDGIISGDRQVLSRAITIVESTLASDRDLALMILNGVETVAQRKNSHRIGFTGVPGVGKSTLIEALGLEFVRHGHKLAVLAIDPSSSLSKGSLLGDKTRMEELSRSPEVYIRPTASSGVLGGLAHNTRQVITLCEAAGFDTIFIETVGVGQSETAVRSVCDMFILLMLSGAGDELQGMKRGIMEMADLLAITKVEANTLQAAKLAKAGYENALHLLLPPESGIPVDVLLTSAFDIEKVRLLYQAISQWFMAVRQNNWYHIQRTRQLHQAFDELIRQLAWEEFTLLHGKDIQDLDRELIARNINVHQAVAALRNQLKSGYESAL